MNEHDIRPIGQGGQGVCVLCSLVYPQSITPEASICPGPAHAGLQPLCGAPLEEPSASALRPEARAVTCRACLEIAADLPPSAGGHDLRAWDGGLACPRCGQWGAEHLAFASCAEGTPRRGLCAPARFPDAPPAGERFSRDAVPPLCGGDGTPGLLHYGLPASPASKTACSACRSRFALMPPLPLAVHDVRLPASSGAACASCGVIAAEARQLGAECDGGRALEAVRERRAGRSRVWLPDGYVARPRHAEDGCAAARSASGGAVLRIRRGALARGQRAAIRERITCIPCVRALAHAPALPA